MDVKAFTDQLDKIAGNIEQSSPELALQIDRVSDVLEGKREASTLEYDADEARYMVDRFNNKVQSREPDEPYMDNFNDNDFSQVAKAYQGMPEHPNRDIPPKAGAPKATKRASLDLPYKKVQ